MNNRNIPDITEQFVRKLGPLLDEVTGEFYKTHQIRVNEMVEGLAILCCSVIAEQTIDHTKEEQQHIIGLFIKNVLKYYPDAVSVDLSDLK